jgi:CBS domain-containing protein
LLISADVIVPVQAIRKKIESELARKRTISTTGVPSRQKRPAKQTAQKGTVAALRPSPALTVPENITVSEASQLCAAKRTDCVLVVDDEEGLSGIFTAKDLAYRVNNICCSASSILIPFSGHRRGFRPAHHSR